MSDIAICGRVICDMDALASYSVVSFVPFSDTKEVSYSCAYEALLSVRRGGAGLFPQIRAYGGSVQSTDVFIRTEDVPRLSRAGRCRSLSCRAYAEKEGESALIKLAVGYAVVSHCCRSDELPAGILRAVDAGRRGLISCLSLSVRTVSLGGEPFSVLSVDTNGGCYRKDPAGTARISDSGFIVRGGQGTPCTRVASKEKRSGTKVRTPVEVYSKKYPAGKDYFLRIVMEAVRAAGLGIRIEPLLFSKSDSLTFAAFSDREPLLSEQKAFAAILAEYGLVIKGGEELINPDDLISALGVPYLFVPDTAYEAFRLDDPRAVIAGTAKGFIETGTPVTVYLPVNAPKAELAVVYRDRFGSLFKRTVFVPRNRNRESGPGVDPSFILRPDGRLLLSVVPEKDEDMEDAYGDDIAPNVQHVTEASLLTDAETKTAVLRAAIRELCISTAIMDGRLDFAPAPSFFSAFYLAEKDDSVRVFRAGGQETVRELSEKERDALFDRAADLGTDSFELLLENRDGQLYELSETGMQAVPYTDRSIESFFSRKKEHAEETGGLYDFSWRFDGDSFFYISGHTRQANAQSIAAYPHIYRIRTLSGDPVGFSPEDVFELLNVGFVRQDRNSTVLPYPFKILRRAGEIEAAKRARGQE